MAALAGARGKAPISMMLMLYFIICPSLVFLPIGANGRIVSGTVNESTSWEFVTRFCFLPDVGRLEFEFVFPQTTLDGANGQAILFYYDDQWPNVYPGDDQQTCEEKMSFISVEDNQLINLTNAIACSPEERAGPSSTIETWHKCTGYRVFTTSRERWWFIVLANCNADQGVYLEYTLTMTNGDDSQPMYKHFSADELYIFPIVLAMLAAYFFLAIIIVYVAHSLRIRQMYHTTYKIYLAAIFLEILSIFSQIVFWGIYSETGRPSDQWKLCGQFLQFMAQALFLILLVLMGKGFTITRGRISTGGIIKLVIFSVLYIVLIFAIFAWEAATFDEGLVIYLYDSVPGYTLIGVRILSWIWFLYAIFFTLKHFPEKSVFYVIFGLTFTGWFWLSNAVALAAIHTIPPWARERVVQGLNLTITIAAYFVFLILTWPTKASKTFPYHIRTSQIAAMNTSSIPPPTHGIQRSQNGQTATNPSGAYGPSSSIGTYEPMGEKEFMKMFVTDTSGGGGGSASATERH